MSYKSRDHRIADEHAEGSGLMCVAHGCPNRWAVDFGARLCSAHSVANKDDWPRVTEAQKYAETQRIIDRQKPKPPQHILSRDEKTALMQRARKALVAMSVPAKAWAHKLKSREEAGEALTLAQRGAWRKALNEEVTA